MIENARPKILDTFCGGGGCSRGYADAGFDVVGIDIKPMPRYPNPPLRREKANTNERTT